MPSSQETPRNFRCYYCYFHTDIPGHMYMNGFIEAIFTMNIKQGTFNVSIRFNLVKFNKIKTNETEGLTELLENTS